MEAFKRVFGSWQKNCAERKNKCWACVGMLLLSGCNTVGKDDWAGVYTAEWTTAFTVVRDTMLIEPPASRGSNAWLVTRRSFMVYQQKPQYKLVRWVAVPEHKNNLLMITNNGRVLSFDPVNREMKMGSTVYKKL